MNKLIKNNHLKKIISIIITGLVITVIIGIILFNSRKKDNFNNNRNNLLENNNDNNQIKDNEPSNNIIKKETKSKKLSLIIIIIIVLLIILVALFLFYNINRNKIFLCFNKEIGKDNLPEYIFHFERVNNLSNLFKYLNNSKSNRFNDFYDNEIKRCEKEIKKVSKEKENEKYTKKLEIFINLLKDFKKDSYLCKIITDYFENILNITEKDVYQKLIDFYREYSCQNNKKDFFSYLLKGKITIKASLESLFFKKIEFENENITYDIMPKSFRLIIGNEERKNEVIGKDGKNINIYKYAKYIFQKIDEMQNKKIDDIIIAENNGFEGIIIFYTIANFIRINLKNFFSNNEYFNNNNENFLSLKMFEMMEKKPIFIKEMDDYHNELIKKIDDKINQENNGK